VTAARSSPNWPTVLTPAAADDDDDRLVTTAAYTADLRPSYIASPIQTFPLHNLVTLSFPSTVPDGCTDYTFLFVYWALQIVLVAPLARCEARLKYIVTFLSVCDKKIVAGPTDPLAIHP